MDSTMSVLDSIQDSIFINTIPSANCASFTYTTNYNTVNFTSTSTCSNGYQYNWVFGDGTYGTGQNTSNVYASIGTYNVTLAVLDSLNNLLDTVTQAVSITSLPPTCNALFSYTQAVDSNNNPVPGHAVITDQSTGSNLSYFWNFGDGNTSTLSNPTHTYSGNGPYVLCLTVSDSNNCTDTFCDTLSVDSNGVLLRRAPGFTIHVGQYNAPTGIAKNLLNETKVYPNPFDNQLILDFEEMEFKTMTIRLFNNVGQEVFRMNRNNSFTNSPINIELSDLEKGIYILNVETDQGSLNKKIIKN